MPLPGGASDKLGNRYEMWWTVSQLIRILNGTAGSIRIEDPGVEKAEFIISCNDSLELHQAKRSHTSGKWSLAILGGKQHRLLQTIFTELSGNDTRFVFVSGSDAPELKELSSRAVDAEDLTEFEIQFLTAKVQKDAFKKLKKYWQNTDSATAYEMLQRIEIRTIDESNLKEMVVGLLSALFLDKPEDVSNVLRRIVEDSVHKNIDREWLTSDLERSGFILRKVVKPNDAAPLGECCA